MSLVCFTFREDQPLRYRVRLAEPFGDKQEHLSRQMKYWCDKTVPESEWKVESTRFCFHTKEQQLMFVLRFSTDAEGV